MPANTLGAIVARVNSLLAAAPFGLVQAQSPFDFNVEPTGRIDQAYRVEAEGGTVIGGMSYSETRQDVLRIWVARKQAAAPQTTYQSLVTDATSITAAVVRDGATLGGDYDVLDEGRGCSFLQEPGREFSVLRLTLSIDYEAQL
jgi:hypothetical protein